jgi:hypothetical protein
MLLRLRLRQRYFWGAKKAQKLVCFCTNFYAYKNEKATPSRGWLFD